MAALNSLDPKIKPDLLSFLRSCTTFLGPKCTMGVCAYAQNQYGLWVVGHGAVLLVVFFWGGGQGKAPPPTTQYNPEGENLNNGVWKRPLEYPCWKDEGNHSVFLNIIQLNPLSFSIHAYIHKNSIGFTYTGAEMHPIIAIDLVWTPYEDWVNYELVVSPLEVRGFLEVTPTFLIHSDSFTLEGRKWNKIKRRLINYSLDKPTNPSCPNSQEW